MKRLFAAFLVLLVLLSACGVPMEPDESAKGTSTAAPTTAGNNAPTTETLSFHGLNDPALLPYLEGDVYAHLIDELNSSSYFVENVSAVYISKEYINELAYNSKENIYFGYNLAELEAQFQGTKFIFTLGDDGQTAVKEFEKYDDTYDRVVRNVAIGTGVILLCVTVSVATGGVAAAPAAASAITVIHAISAASASAAAIGSLSGGIIGGATAGIVTGFQTKDFDAALKSAALAGSEGFMWGAITGAITGGAGKAIALKGAATNGLTMAQAAAIQRESKYPLDVIKQLQNVEQYDILKNGGLVTQTINGRAALVRNIDWNLFDEATGLTNLQRVMEGLSPLGPDGYAYELHHIGQQTDATLAILTKTEHMKNGNNLIWHPLRKGSTVSRGSEWSKQVREFWNAVAKAQGVM